MVEKCPVCDYVIEKDRVEVKVGDRTVAVCCQECADALRTQQPTK